MYNSRSARAGNCILGWIFLPREDLCLKPQLFKIAASRAWKVMARTSRPRDTCQALLIEEPARGHMVKNRRGFGLHPEFSISRFLCPSLKNTGHEANSNSPRWSLLLGVFEALRTSRCRRWPLRCTQSLQQLA